MLKDFQFHIAYYRCPIAKYANQHVPSVLQTQSNILQLPALYNAINIKRELVWQCHIIG